MKLFYLWQKYGLAAAAAGISVSAYLCLTGSGHDPADLFNYLLITVFSAWGGAMAGGALDWARHHRPPTEPFFKGHFRWYYRQRWWLRLAAVFGFGWAAFVASAVTVAMAAGATDEARPFFTLKGAALILVFLFVFALEGALAGVIVDLACYFAGTQGKRR